MRNLELSHTYLYSAIYEATTEIMHPVLEWDMNPRPVTGSRSPAIICGFDLLWKRCGKCRLAKIFSLEAKFRRQKNG